MLFANLTFTSLLKHKKLLSNKLHNNLKKNLCNKVNAVQENNFKTEFINMYINKKQLKSNNSISTYCKYCKDLLR